MTSTDPRDIRALEMLERLVSFNTTSHLPNMGLIKDVQGLLAGHGVESTLFEDEKEKDKANLFATIGPKDRPGVVLSGHTDVVPVDGQEWASDPFTLRDGGDKVFGRGTCDMKGFAAVCLAMLDDFTAAELKNPVHFAFSYDEETGCTGVHSLIRALQQAPVRPHLCIVGEPTSMNVIVGHKGIRHYTAAVRGFETHSSLAPSGVNAVEYAARLIAFLSDEHRARIKNGPHAEGYDVGHSTVHVGLVHGGTALNIVPRDCVFEFEIRNIPEEDIPAFERTVAAKVEALNAEMRAIQPETGITLTQVSDTPGLSIDPDHEAVTLVKQLAGRNEHARVAYGTEAGLFQEWAKIPTVVCGPGSIEQAHKPDEFVLKSQLVKCREFMDRLTERLKEGL
ncbi:MAG: acetylornithine deacetylase [Rhodospirillales bacterium]